MPATYRPRKRRKHNEGSDDETRRITAIAVAIVAGRLRLCDVHKKPCATPWSDLRDPNGIIDDLLKVKEILAVFPTVYVSQPRVVADIIAKAATGVAFATR
jgi:hypothetical protein